jgi:hypothetical protein
VLAESLQGWAAHLGGVDELVVIHDRHGAGVAASKNRSIAALMDLGCEHLVLADDDVHPIRDEWWRPYVDNSQPHLAHCWGKSRFLCADEETGTTVWNWPRGVMLYVERRVVEKVGGMRTEFGVWGGEHAEWSRRMFNAGLTRAPFADAAAARHGIWYCADYTRKVASSVPKSLRDDPARITHRHNLYKLYRDSTDFVPYR